MQGFSPNTRALAPRARSKTGLGVGCEEGVAPSRCEGPGVFRKIFENSDAKSCILVTTCCEISCFLKTTAKKLGDPYIVGTLNLKVGDQSLPVPTVVAPMVTVSICGCSE